MIVDNICCLQILGEVEHNATVPFHQNHSASSGMTFEITSEHVEPLLASPSLSHSVVSMSYVRHLDFLQCHRRLPYRCSVCLGA